MSPALFNPFASALLAARILLTHLSPFETNTKIIVAVTERLTSDRDLPLTITDIYLPRGKQSSCPGGSSYSGPAVVRHPRGTTTRLSLSSHLFKSYRLPQ